MGLRILSALFVCLLGVAGLPATADYINFETPQVHPIDMSPDGSTLAVCNTADGYIEFYALASGTPVPIGSVPVGYDPTTVRFRTNTEVWAVNQISDSVSIINLTSGTVVATLQTDDEPADVVFADGKAFVSCSQVNKVQVFDLANLGNAPTDIAINAEDPRAMAVSNDGSEVYVAIFESGNRSTLLGGGSGGGSVITFPPNVVDDSNTPHGTMNPPFNGAGAFIPAKAANGTAPKVGLIVKQDANDDWLDDTGSNWNAFITGANAGQSGRPVGWTLLDHDVAVIDTDTLDVSYIDHMMNICMGIAVNPSSGKIGVIGSDATNEIRFEPNINGTFTRVHLALSDATDSEPDSIVDLNAHLDYASERFEDQADRDKAIGDPRGMVWNSAGNKAYITGMGSNNLIVVDSAGARNGIADTIEVREGPTGLALDETRNQLYVLNRFDGSISVVSTTTELETANVTYFDPTPPAIKTGRKHLYDTHKNSGLGQAACASCHVDGRMDRLAWDLGDPSGSVASLANRNLGGGIPLLSGGIEAFDPFHPMKGPMTTQTFQGIIGQEPFHWRGDRLGLEEFNPAFIGLQGDDTNLTAVEMQEFEDFVETIHFPPNPYRNLDNTLPTDLDIGGEHFAPPGFDLTAGDPLPNGDAVAGLALYRDQTRRLDQGVAACVTCHTLPSGGGSDTTWNGSSMETIPAGPNGERHLMLVSIDGSTQTSIKVPHLRNLYDKVGMNMIHTESRAGFGYIHDGSADSIERFVSEGAFDVANTQEIADLTALMLAFTGSDFVIDDPAGGFLEPPGVASNDVHAAVGKQVTIDGSEARSLSLFNDLLAAVEASPRVRLIGKGLFGSDQRGALYIGDDLWQTDEDATVLTTTLLFQQPTVANPFTFMVVPASTAVRIGLDRDGDGCFDFDEVNSGTDPADPNDTPVDCESIIGEGEGEGGLEGEFEGEVICENDAPLVDFDAAMTQLDNNGIFQQLGGDFSLDPLDADINGGFNIGTQDVFPNGLLDSYEIALIAKALADPSLNISGGISHAAVANAWSNNHAQMIIDLGPTAPQLLGGIDQLLTAIMTLGDSDSRSFVVTLMTLANILGPQAGVTDVSIPDVDDYIFLNGTVSLNGDADDDGSNNEDEYDFFVDRGDVAHTVTSSVTGGGSVSPAGIQNVSAGGSQTFEFTANPGWRLVDVQVDGMSCGPLADFLFIKQRADYLVAALDASITPASPGSLLTAHNVVGVFEPCGSEGEGEGEGETEGVAEGEGGSEGLFEGEGAGAEGEGEELGEEGEEEGEFICLPIQPIEVDFCQAFDDLVNNALLENLDGDFDELLALLDPATADLNGSYFADISNQNNLIININGNGILDASNELAVLAAILGDPCFNNGVLNHNEVRAAWEANRTQLLDEQIGSTGAPLIGQLIPGLTEVLVGYITLGDGQLDSVTATTATGSGSFGFVAGVFALLTDLVNDALPNTIDDGTLDKNDFITLDALTVNADADGDGDSNLEEHLCGVGGPLACGPSIMPVPNYVDAALGPNITCDGIFEGEVGEGEGEGRVEGASEGAEGEIEGGGEGGVEGGEGSPEGGFEGSIEGGGEGSSEGAEGEADGEEGESEGTEGQAEGGIEGGDEGSTEGNVNEEGEGSSEGSTEGGDEGTSEGSEEGSTEGSTEGGEEGTSEGNEGAPDGEDFDGIHDADQDGNGLISLSELLRVIQFFNSGGLSCAVPADSTEDGFQPGAGGQSCVPHASDYNPQDWDISLSELLRVIQFFNGGGYFYCPDVDPPTEDGFCPGQPEA